MAKKKFISGIHNWCDRWCERCPFVSRCAVGAAEAAMPDEAKDMNNEAFWQALADSFAKTKEMLYKAAKVHGIDLDNIPEEELEQSRREEEELSERSMQHPITVLAMSYSDAGHAWLQSNALKEKADAAVKEMEMGIRDIDDGEREFLQINECLEVIQWYLHFIAAKCYRLNTETDENAFWEQYPPSERSYNGTAKIALIAIERSISAWALLMEMLPGEEDAIVDLPAMLQRLKRMIEAEFPDAWSFIRPGFDE